MLSIMRTGPALLLASLSAGFFYPGVPNMQLRFPSSASSLFAAARSTGPDAAALKTKAADFMSNNGFYAPPKPDMLAEDFVFFGPIIGPLTKTDYLETLDLVKIYVAFPDITADQSEWGQDAHQPNRFWSVLRVQGTHTGPLNLGVKVVQPTGKEMIVGPQANSVTFNNAGLITKVTSGYVVDVREGKTGSFGLVYAALKSIGLPVPTGTLNKISSELSDRFGKGLKTKSHRDDLPELWRHLGRTSGVRSAEWWTKK